MKKIYILFLLASFFYTEAQTTVSYAQRAENYYATFTDGGGNFNSGSDEFGMWANSSGSKQSVAWRNFTENGSIDGTLTTMNVNDSFTITVSATQSSYGVIGLALLSSPSSTNSWADRINNYAVQVNLNGNNGANDPWEVVSNGNTITSSSIGGSTNYVDTKFKFTLDSVNTMTVSINDGAESFTITLNNQNITGYSVYFADDWNGAANANIYWKQTTEYVYAEGLHLSEFQSKDDLLVYPNPVQNSFMLNRPVKLVEVFNIEGKLIKSFQGDFEKNHSFDVSSFETGLYFITLDKKSNLTHKFVKY
jgi:hypothetical protein